MIYRLKFNLRSNLEAKEYCEEFENFIQIITIEIQALYFFSGQNKET